MDAEILIIGAGAAGLFAAYELGKKGKKVILLEAKDRTGGRIHTLQDPLFELPVEAGAEYVHGNLKLSKKLLREAGIEFYAASGDLWRAADGKLEKQQDFVEDEKELLKKLKGLENDMSVISFLDTYFPGEKYADLRKSLISFVEGYDAADASQASCFALLQEMVAEDGEQYRIKGGYVKLVNYLEDKYKETGCSIHLQAVVTSIEWKSGHVTVSVADGRIYTASKIIVTVPNSILQLQQGETGYISITPLPPEKYEAIHALGNTGVIKIILQFREAFWQKKVESEKNKGAKVGFVFSDEAVPTWWTQLPQENGMITGWLAGTKALMQKDSGDEEMLEKAIRSLANIFSMKYSVLRELLVSHHIINWMNDPFIRGAYVYEKVESKNAKRILNTPLDNTLFFAGEALYEGPQHGTIEGALLSAQYVTELIIQTK